MILLRTPLWKQNLKRLPVSSVWCVSCCPTASSQYCVHTPNYTRGHWDREWLSDLPRSPLLTSHICIYTTLPQLWKAILSWYSKHLTSQKLRKICFHHEILIFNAYISNENFPLSLGCWAVWPIIKTQSIFSSLPKKTYATTFWIYVPLGYVIMIVTCLGDSHRGVSCP